MYIDSRHKLFDHLDRLAGWAAGEKPAPVTVEWDLSNRCALGCQDCHFAHTHVRGPWATRKRILPMAYDAGGDLADVVVVKRALGEMARAGVKGIVWSGGGEPTTHPDWLEVVQHAQSLGLQQGMYTFGGLLTETTAKQLAQVAVWIVVSLDCVDSSDYAKEKGVPPARFLAACSGIVSLASAKSAKIGISFLLHEENWWRMPEMLALARGLGATYATFRPAIRTSPDHPAVCLDDRSWVTEALPIFATVAAERDVELDVQRFVEYRDWQARSYSVCHGIKLTAVVTPDARIWVCPQRRGIPGSEVGDLKTHSFEEIWSTHRGTWTDFTDCRVMCRLHLMNQTLADVYAPREHGAFL